MFVFPISVNPPLLCELLKDNYSFEYFFKFFFKFKSSSIKNCDNFSHIQNTLHTLWITQKKTKVIYCICFYYYCVQFYHLHVGFFFVLKCLLKKNVLLNTLHRGNCRLTSAGIQTFFYEIRRYCIYSHILFYKIYTF